MGKDFWANLIVLESRGIDVILGMGWLAACDAVIQCSKRSVLLTSPAGDRIKFPATSSPSFESTVNQLDGKVLEDIIVRCEYTKVLPDRMSGMPLDQEA